LFPDNLARLVTPIARACSLGVPLLFLFNLFCDRNYLLAQAQVDASHLSSSIAHLNTSTTFSPLQPLQDTDVSGYLRVAHEQNLISTIEEGRKETQEEFYRVLEERSQRDWEAKKKHIFEELGGRVGGGNRAISELRSGTHGKSSLMVSSQSLAPTTLIFLNFVLVKCHTKSFFADAKQNDGL
jgi:nuclear pore complex protein Nup93